MHVHSTAAPGRGASVPSPSIPQLAFPLCLCLSLTARTVCLRSTIVRHRNTAFCVGPSLPALPSLRGEPPQSTAAYQRLKECTGSQLWSEWERKRHAVETGQSVSQAGQSKSGGMVFMSTKTKLRATKRREGGHRKRRRPGIHPSILSFPVHSTCT